MPEKEKVTEKFEEKVKETDSYDENVNESYIREKQKEITEGIKYVPTNTFGTLIFEYPNLGLQLEGDRIFLDMKHKHLLKGDLLSQHKMAILLGEPMTVCCPSCQKKVQVGEGTWDEKKEKEIEILNDEIQEHSEKFNNYRREMQEIVDKIIPDMDETKLKTLENKRDALKKKAFKQFEFITHKRARSISLVYQKYNLFQGCIEEVADNARTKFLAPRCIKKMDGNLLWSSEEEMLKGGPEAGRIFGLFHFYLRNVDVNFFDQVLGILQPE